MKMSLIIIALALLAGLLVIGLRPDEPAAAITSDPSRGPSFEVRVEKPPLARPLFGILPMALERKLAGDGELRFDNATRGAEVGSVGPDRLELRAEGWELSIEIDSEGRIAPTTHLVFPVTLSNKQRRLRCRPSDRAVGYLRTSTREGSDALDGRFRVEFAVCKNDETGKAIEWPPAALTARGQFEQLSPRREHDDRQ